MLFSAPSSMVVPAATFTAPDWSLNGPKKTLFLPEVISATVDFAKASTSGSIFAKGDIFNMPLSNPPQVSMLFHS